MAKLAAALVAIGLAAGITVLLQRHSAEPPPARPPSAEAAPSPWSAARGGDPQATAVDRVVAQERRRTLEVRGGADRRPLAQAFLGTLPPAGSTVTHDVIARADDSGRIAIQEPLPGAVLVRCPGFVPLPLGREDEWPAEVVLEEAAVLTVVVLDDRGLGVAGADVYLARDRTLGNPVLREATGPAPDFEPSIGHPHSDAPLWKARTGADGRATLDELPSARLALFVHDDLSVPATEVGDGAELRLARGPTTVHVAMQPWHAVVFRLPTPVAVKDRQWSVPVMALSRTRPVLSRLPRIRNWLEQRFEGCLAYAHVPDLLAAEVFVQCVVETADGGRYTGRWPLRPVRELDEPVFLELDPATRLPVTVRLLGPEGREYRNIPLGLTGTDDPEAQRFRGMTGEPILLPPGSFDVRALMLARPIFHAFQDCKITVGADQPLEHIVRSTADLVEVVVRPRLPEGEVLSSLEIYFDNEVGRGPATVNWRPARGPIHQFLEAKRLSIRVRSNGYEDLDVPEREVAVGEPIFIDVHLTPKRRR